jgi:membrane protease YdiL (CAAX protease family)
MRLNAIRFLTLSIFLALVLFLSISAIIVTFSYLDIPYPERKKAISLITWSSFINVVIIASIYEELKYRLAIVYSPLNISICLSIWSVFFLSYFFLENKAFQRFDFYCFLIIVFAILILIIFSISNSLRLFVARLYNSTGELKIIIISSLIFAIMHSLNFNFQSNIQLVVLVPHFFSGIIFSYCRIRMGLIYSILLHLVNNSIPFVVSFL